MTFFRLPEDELTEASGGGGQKKKIYPPIFGRISPPTLGMISPLLHQLFVEKCRWVNFSRLHFEKKMEINAEARKIRHSEGSFTLFS